MIVRILGEGQYDVPDENPFPVNVLDDRLESVVDGGDGLRYPLALRRLLVVVRRIGTPVPDHVLVPSDLILPGDDMDLPTVTALLDRHALERQPGSERLRA